MFASQSVRDWVSHCLHLIIGCTIWDFRETLNPQWVCVYLIAAPLYLLSQIAFISESYILCCNSQDKNLLETCVRGEAKPWIWVSYCVKGQETLGKVICFPTRLENFRLMYRCMLFSLCNHHTYKYWYYCLNNIFSTLWFYVLLVVIFIFVFQLHFWRRLLNWRGKAKHVSEASPALQCTLWIVILLIWASLCRKYWMLWRQRCSCS